MAAAASVDLLGVVEAGGARSPQLPDVTAQPLQLVRWQDTLVRLLVRSSQGPAYNLAGKTISWNVRRNSGDGGWLLRKTGVGPALTLGTGFATWTVAATDLRALAPGRYVHDAWVVDVASGAQTQIIPVSLLVVLAGMLRSS